VERKGAPVANLYRDEIWTIRDRLRAGAAGNNCRSCWYNCRGEIESLYSAGGVIKSLPTLLLDRGAADRADGE
jgi:hypothetical protein